MEGAVGESGVLGRSKDGSTRAHSGGRGELRSTRETLQRAASNITHRYYPISPMNYTKRGLLKNHLAKQLSTTLPDSGTAGIYALYSALIVGYWDPTVSVRGTEALGALREPTRLGPAELFTRSKSKRKVKRDSNSDGNRSLFGMQDQSI